MTAASRKTNRIGLTSADYKGAPSTLCAGCGHDAISSQIVRAFFELGIEPHRVAKMSGIGCSSKTPAYFLGRSHGFNSVCDRTDLLVGCRMMHDYQHWETPWIIC